MQRAVLGASAFLDTTHRQPVRLRHQRLHAGFVNSNILGSRSLHTDTKTTLAAVFFSRALRFRRHAWVQDNSRFAYINRPVYYLKGVNSETLLTREASLSLRAHCH